MMNNDVVGVAHVKYVCPVCCKESDSALVLNQRLTKRAKEEVERMHEKVLGYADEMCKECKKTIGEGAYIIIVDDSKFEEGNPYRTGHVIGVTKECIEKNHDEETAKNILKYQMMFMDIKVAEKSGVMDIFKESENDSKEEIKNDN